jgi:hypothetical protein
MQRGRGDSRIKREQPLGAAERAARRATDKLVDGGVERQRTCLDFFTQGVPGDEAVLACDHGLGVVQGVGL